MDPSTRMTLCSSSIGCLPSIASRMGDMTEARSSGGMYFSTQLRLASLGSATKFARATDASRQFGLMR
jgi:hypothetical protein